MNYFKVILYIYISYYNLSYISNHNNIGCNILSLCWSITQNKSNLLFYWMEIYESKKLKIKVFITSSFLCVIIHKVYFIIILKPLCPTIHYVIVCWNCIFLRQCHTSLILESLSIIRMYVKLDAKSNVMVKNNFKISRKLDFSCVRARWYCTPPDRRKLVRGYLQTPLIFNLRKKTQTYMATSILLFGLKSTCFG